MISKRYKLRQGFLKTKQNFLLFQKKFGNEPEQNFSSTDRKRYVSIQNFVSKRNIFDLFWNKSSKTRKLLILKERWFDIATREQE
jgi:hypothetical protein